MDEVNYPPVNADNWIQIGQERKAGVRKLVMDSDDVSLHSVCWFKYPLSDDMGPIPANEYIAHKIGLALGLPVAKIQFKEFADLRGSISFIVAPEPYKWAQFPHKNKLHVYLDNYDILAHITAFDIFINNLDRNHDNLLYSVTSIRQKKYTVWMIDHGHSLLGPSKQPTPKESFNFEQMVMIPELQDLFTNGIDFFEPAINRIKQLDAKQFKKIIDEVPNEYLTPEQRDHVLDMLLYRQDKLYNEIINYCQMKGS